MSGDAGDGAGRGRVGQEAAFWQRLFLASVGVFSVLTVVLALQTWNLNRRVILLEDTRRTALALGVSEQCVAELERCDELVEVCLSTMAWDRIGEESTADVPSEP